MKKLDYLTIKLCEKLPLNITLFEKNGFCQKPPYNCEYCKEKSKEVYFCYKKTKTFDLNRKYLLV